MKIKNTAKGGRGIGVDSVTHHWEPGEVKEIDDAIIAKAKKDPANAALLGDDGDLQAVSLRVSVNDGDGENKGKTGAAK